MKLRRRLLVFSILAACLGGSLPATASGTYCACLPKPPARSAKASIDKDKMDLGQKVYNGRTAAAPASADAAAQLPKLQALQARLPEKVARKKDLTLLAGKLTPEQLSALEYFVDQRYPQGK